MKKKMSIINTTFVLAIISSAVIFSNCTNSNGSTVNESQIDSLRAQVKQLTANDATIATNLAKFDTLDYTVFTNQQWDRLHESHAADIKVYWPDGHMTEGIEKHIEDLKALFVFAPDTRIKEHPIRIGSGNLTAVTGVFEGTFTKPMPIGNGKTIPPTGKAFKLPMCTVGVWKADGTMSEEHLFWDNQTFMKQIGLAN
jgi:SnoaL-like polyketide cyclase